MVRKLVAVSESLFKSPKRQVVSAPLDAFRSFQNLTHMKLIQIHIFGVGCAKHRALRQAVDQVLADLGYAAMIEEVEEIETFLEMGISLVPTLVINGLVFSKGRVPSVEELRDYLRREVKPGEAV